MKLGIILGSVITFLGCMTTFLLASIFRKNPLKKELKIAKEIIKKNNIEEEKHQEVVQELKSLPKDERIKKQNDILRGKR